MDPEVISGRPTLLSIESSESSANAGERFDVNPKDAGAGVALKGPHVSPGSNGRAELRRRVSFPGELMPSSARAAVAGEG